MTGPRTIALLTTGRQDWGILRSPARAIEAEPGLRLVIVAGGMHVSSAFGHTVDDIRADGLAPEVLAPWLPDDPGVPTPPADVQAAGALAAVGAWLRTRRPDAILVAGDRLETAAAALAATLAGVPIAHLHGGEQTLGAFDDALRHAITKMAHLHLVSHEEHARRVEAMGEDPAAIHVVGAPGLDNLHRADLPDRGALEAMLGIALEPPVIVVTVHPSTLGDDAADLADAVTGALDTVDATCVVTLPNSDPGADELGSRLRAWAAGPRRIAVTALGERGYWGLLRVADAMAGNSSSGLIEAPALRLPVVNVGDRQAGRRRDANVIDVPADAAAVTAALSRALDPATRAAIPDIDPRNTDGRAGERVARIIASWQPPNPPRKPPIRVSP